MIYVCRGCGKELCSGDVKTIGPGTLTWCHTCVKDGTKDRIAKELWDEYEITGDVANYLSRSHGEVRKRRLDNKTVGKE